MPLRQGKSNKVKSENIRTEMHKYERTGEVGRGSHPKSKKAAQKQAVAIALSKAREKKASCFFLEKIASMLEKERAEEIDRGDKGIPIEYKNRPYHEKFFTRMKLRTT